MRTILLIVLFPLATYALPKVSVSCLLLGDWGCDIKCELKCLLLGCETRGGTCAGWSHCECYEVYNVGDTTLTNADFENLDFVVLWNRIFKTSDASTKILEQIKKDDHLEIQMIKLLRDPYMTGDDVIALLKRKYPTWKTVNSLVSLQYGWKTEIMEPGKHIQYDELDANMDKLLDLMETVPPDGLESSQYKVQVRNVLKNITKVGDLEEILYLVKLSGNKNLYRLVKSSLINLGYGFEEDGDNPAGKKAILQSISVGLEDADDDEKLEVAVAKKLMHKNSSSNPPIKKNILRAEDIDNSLVQEQTYTSKGNNQNSVNYLVLNAPNPAPVAPADIQYGEKHYFPWKASTMSTGTVNGNANSNWNSIGFTGFGNPVTGYGDAIFNGGQEINPSAQASKAFILVVDADGNIVQANEIPQNIE